MGPALAIPLIAQLGQTALGLFQSRKARKEFENADMPDYAQSDAYKTSEATMNLAGRYAQEGLPENAMRFQEDMIGRSGAAALASAGSLRAGVGGVASAATSLADQYRQLAAMDANAQIQARGEYMRQRENFQGDQQRAFDDQMGNFINQQAARLGRMSAGNQTMNAGLAGLSSTAAMGVEQGGGKTLMEVLLGGNYGQGGQRGTAMTPMTSLGLPTAQPQLMLPR